MNVRRQHKEAAMTNRSFISIGLPVFNGANYLPEAVRSILEQTHSNFELIIPDNASTDETPEICHAYAAADQRIRYHRHETNRGASWNYRRVFELSSGRYFKWAVHDDVLGPEFLSRCLEALEGDPSATLCYTPTRFIDERGELSGTYRTTLDDVSSPKPQKRFRDLILTDHLCLEVFGLIRSRVLRMTPLIEDYVASDRVLLAELGLRGRLLEIPEALFFCRDHPERSVRALPFHKRIAWYHPASSGKSTFPHWRFYAEYFKCLKRVPLQRSERLW